VTIEAAVDLKELLLKALASQKDIRIRMEGATELDVTALQLLHAAGRDAAAAGVRFTLAGPVPSQITAVMHDTGFQSSPSE
jgi:anti-anti-sigma regulatory factor